MTLLALILAIFGFALLGLTTDAHALARLHRRPDQKAKERRRIAAWLSLGAALAASIAARGWIYGPILWFGMIMFGAGLVFLAFNLVPVKARRSPRD